MSLWAGFTWVSVCACMPNTDYVTFVPNKNDHTRPAQKLVIDRVHGALDVQPVVFGEEPPKHDKQFIVHGILGIISLHTTDFLVVITNRKRVAHVLDSTIYLATDFRMLPISSDANPLLLTHPVEKKLLGLVKESLYSGPLYFSYEYDLTSSMQHQIQQSAGAAAGAAVPPMWQRADERFFWNRHLQERFIAHAQAHPGASLDAFIMPVMFGFLEVKLASVNGRSFVLGLVARRSRHRAGTRYFSRGVDADGHVSNSVETEQFVLIDPPSLQQPKDMEDVEGKTRLSFVQTRGSVPVFWAEVNTLRYKPDLLIPDDPRTGAAISRHFAQQVSTYGKTYIVNLVNQSGYEKPVKEAFERAVQYLNNPLVSYTYFDFHHACKGMKFDRAALVFDQLEREGFALDDYFSLDTVAAPRLQLQKSVVRTNCMDCLDRTNVVQSLLARCVLTDQLRRVGVFTPRDRVEDHPKLLHLFRNVWADHADVISKAYSGTGALKTDFTRTGKRSTEGLLQDGVNSLWRYLKNNLADGKRQDAYDLITGAWDSAHGVPHADTRAWHVCLMPWLLLVALVLALAGVVLPAADVERPYAVDTGKVPVFVLVWVAVALYALLFIWQHGVQYVGWPTLNHPEHLIQYISGEAPKEPVASKKSGLLYEKRLIERYIDEHGRDPITGEELALDDLIALKSCAYVRATPTDTAPATAFPRPPTHSSVPSLLSALQNEYDAMVFETLALKKQHDAVRQELAHALYTNDASMRVIARLMKERDEAREALASVHRSLGVPTDDVEMSAAGALPDDTVASIEAKASDERRARIKSGAPEGYTTPAGAPQLALTAAITSLHNASSPGITALDVSANGALALTGGRDKNVLVVERASEKVVATLRGHAKAITAVAFAGRANPPLGAAAAALAAPSHAVSASADGTVRVWQADGTGYALAHTLQGYDAEVTGVAVHPTDALVGSASRDGSWALHALATGERLLHVAAPAASDDEGSGYTYESFAFHPDGQLAATGTADGVIRVWDLKQGKQSAVFRGHDGAVHTLDFSQNGYLLAAGSRGSAGVKVWDLRKLEVARTATAACAGPVSDAVHQVRFDPSAQLLAVVGEQVSVFAGKALTPCVTAQPTPKTITSVQWSPVDGALLLAGLDRAVRTMTVAP